jgi:quercetin dioxygenase-like cupin family protein
VKTFRLSAAPGGAGDPQTFTGAVMTTRLASDGEGTPVNVYRVAFESGARTHWHVHSGPQWLFVIEGRVRARAAGGERVDLEAGDAVVFAAGEKHWHGAAPGSRGVHLAVNVNLTTTWLEPVTEAEYR